MPSAIIVTYSAASGPQDQLADYLYAHNYDVLLIRHILPNTAANSLMNPSQSTASCNISGSYHVRDRYTHKLDYPYRYIVEFCLSVFWALKFSSNSNLFFGVGNICALSGIFVRLIGQCRKVVFYAIDVVPTRFDNYFLNNVYWFVEAIASRFSSVIWNLSASMETGRHANSVLVRILGQATSIVVPMGALTLTDDPNTLHRRRHTAPTVCYFGNLNERTGADQLVNIFMSLRSKQSGIRMLVIGDGPCAELLQAQARDCKLGDAVTFFGFVSDEAAVQSILSSAWVAIAPYRVDATNFVRFADPGKLKAYLAAGLPIVGTEVSPTIDILQRSGCAIAVATIEQLIDETSSLLCDYDKRLVMSNISFEQSKTFQWSTIFSTAMISLQ